MNSLCLRTVGLFGASLVFALVGCGGDSSSFLSAGPQQVLSSDKSATERPRVSFAAAVNYPANDQPAMIVPCDLNEDGYPDVLLANQYPGAPGVSVLMNDGTGVFLSPVEYGPGANGDDTAAIACADINADGHMDAISCGQTDNSFFLLSDGKANLTLQRGPVTSGFAISVAACDFNADGNTDLAYVTNLGDVDLFYGLGNGQFGQRRTFHLLTSSPIRWLSGVVSADVEGDGTPEFLIFSHSASTVFVMRGAGQNNPLTTVQRYLGSPVKLAVGEFTGTPGIDIAMLTSVQTNAYVTALSILQNDGSGTFSAAQTIDRHDWDPEGLAVGDFDRDGRADVAVSLLLPESVVEVYFNPASGIHRPTTLVVGQSPRFAATADVDNDGWPDILTSNFDASVSVLRNLGR